MAKSEFLKKATVNLTVLSGLVLLALLPLGMTGELGVIFQAVFGAHLILHLLAVVFSLTYIFKLGGKGQESYRMPCFYIFFVMVAGIALCSLPPVDLETLSFDYFIPARWLAAGKIVPVSWHEQSFAPVLAHLAYAGFFSLNLQVLAVIYSFSWIIILGACVGFFLESIKIDNRAIILSVFAAISVPYFFRAGTTPGPELVLAVYSFITFFGLARFYARGKGLILASIAAGLAAGAAWQGVLLILMVPAFVLVIKIKTGGGVFKSIFASCTALFFCVLIYSPWMIKNAIWAGNPFFPLLGSIFASVLPPIYYDADTMHFIVNRYDSLFFALFDIVTLPLQIVFFGQDKDLHFFNGVVTPLFFISFFPLVLVRKRKWLGLAYSFIAVYGLLAITFDQPSISILIPAIVVALPLTGYGMIVIFDFLKDPGRRILYQVLMLMQFAYMIFYAADLARERHLFEYINNSEYRSKYTESNTHDFNEAEAVNSLIGDEDSIVLLMVESEFYLYNKKIASEGPRSARWLLKYIHSAESADSLYREFNEIGIHYVLTDIKRLQKYMMTQTRMEHYKLWEEFQTKYLHSFQEAGRYQILEVREGDAGIE